MMIATSLTPKPSIWKAQSKQQIWYGKLLSKNLGVLAPILETDR